jgi:hypothetical protein
LANELNELNEWKRMKAVAEKFRFARLVTQGFAANAFIRFHSLNSSALHFRLWVRFA